MGGELRYGERLDNEEWMCEHFDVGRSTLRKAIDALVKEGLLERRPKKGVYVKYSKFKDFDQPFSLFQELQRQGVTPSSKILFFSRQQADESMQDVFHCDEDEVLLSIHRLRYANDTPIVISQVTIPERFVPDFDPWRLRNTSLFEILKDDYGIQIVKSIQKVVPTCASKEQAKLLEIPGRTLLLETTSTSTSSSGEIVEYSKSWINTDATKYSFRFSW